MGIVVGYRESDLEEDVPVACCFKTSLRSSLVSQRDFVFLLLGPVGNQGLALEWWIQVSNLGTLTTVGVAKITVCGPSQTNSTST